MARHLVLQYRFCYRLKSQLYFWLHLLSTKLVAILRLVWSCPNHFLSRWYNRHVGTPQTRHYNPPATNIFYCITLFFTHQKAKLFLIVIRSNIIYIHKGKFISSLLCNAFDWKVTTTTPRKCLKSSCLGFVDKVNWHYFYFYILYLSLTSSYVFWLFS